MHIMTRGNYSLGIAMEASRDLSFPLPMTAAALAQVYTPQHTPENWPIYIY